MTLYEFVDDENDGEERLSAEVMFKKTILDEIDQKGSSAIKVETLRGLWQHNWITKLSDFALTDNGLSLVVQRRNEGDKRQMPLNNLKDDDVIIIGRAPGTADKGVMA